MRILYLYPKEYYDTKMSMGRVLYGEAVARQPGVELKFWGPGWPGYNDSYSLMHNIRATKESWDVAWFYKAGRIGAAQQFPGVRVVSFNEANAPQTIEEIRSARASVVIFHHENDMPRWKFLTEEGINLIHLPHGADRNIFTSCSDVRPFSTILSGVVSKGTYPLRDRFATLIRSQQLMNAYIRGYPGHRLKTNEACRAQYAAYSLDLQMSRVSLCCTSKFKYALAKLVESMAAGCLVVSDMPDDPTFQNTLGKYIIEVSPSATDEELIRVVTDAAASWSPERVAEGRKLALEEFSTDNYAERFLKAMQ